MSELNGCLSKKNALKHTIYTMQLMGISSLTSTLQRMVYILREMGVPIFYRYNVYFYGPYSDELDKDLHTMRIWGEINKEENGVYRVSTDTFNVVDFNFIKKVKDSISFLTKITHMDLNSENLEMIQFILYSIKALDNFDIPTIEDNVVKEVKKWVGTKYNDESISIIYRILKSYLKEGLCR